MLDRLRFGSGAIDVDRDHAPAARLDRVLDRGRAAPPAAHAPHRAGERADVGAESGDRAGSRSAESENSQPAAPPISAPTTAPSAAPLPALREPSLECGASPPTGVMACCPGGET